MDMSEPQNSKRQPPESPTAARKSALETDEDYSKYAVTSRTEIVYILRAMKESGALITIYFNHGRDFLLTSLLDVANDGHTIALDLGSSMEMNRRALESEKLICISSLGKVKIQFVLAGVDRIKFGKGEAFEGAVPDSLVRLQRREYYRVTTPLAERLVCRIPIPREEALDLQVIDISAGGVALIVPADNRHVQTDAEFADCRIDLTNVGSITTRLRVRNIHELTLANGKTLTRSGCVFVKPPGTMVRLVQRYIMQIERERKLREMGEL